MKNPKRLNLEEVELNKNYALIINSNAGLWGYSIGDTVKFVSKNPYRLSCDRSDQTFYFCIWRTCDRRRSGKSDEG